MLDTECIRYTHAHAHAHALSHKEEQERVVRNMIGYQQGIKI